MPVIALLGPQRFHPTLRDVIDGLGIGGTVAAVTAGWQEREEEDDELSEHLGGRAVNLRLHGRSEELFAEDPELFAAHRQRQDRLKELQELYRLRLDLALEAARELLRRSGPPDLLEPERQAALDAVRTLDDHHLERIREVHREFERSWQPRERPAVARHRAEIAAILDRAEALAIAGGHVAVLLNRLRLFGVLEMAGERPIVAWSAGTMALAERVVLFHDHPPQGAGNAEVLEEGLACCPGVLPLPHAERRLRLGDRVRVALFARRFAPAAALAMGTGSRVILHPEGDTELADVQRLTTHGELVELAAPQ